MRMVHMVVALNWKLVSLISRHFLLLKVMLDLMTILKFQKSIMQLIF